MIETVKILKDSEGNAEAYLVNGTMAVPLDESNRHYRAVQDWISAGGEPVDE